MDMCLPGHMGTVEREKRKRSRTLTLVLSARELETYQKLSYFEFGSVLLSLFDRHCLYVTSSK